MPRSMWLRCAPLEISVWRAFYEHQRFGYTLCSLPQDAGGAVHHHRKDPSILLPRHRSANAGHPDSAQDRNCVLGWHRSHHQDVALQAFRAQGLVPVRGQPWVPEEGPAANGSTEVPSYTCPVHLLACRDSPPGGCDPVVAAPLSSGRTPDAASDAVAVLRSWVTARGSPEAIRHRRGLSEFPSHYSQYQVLQVPAGSYQRGSDKSAARLRKLAGGHASIGRRHQYLLPRQTWRSCSSMRFRQRIQAVAKTCRRAAFRRRSLPAPTSRLSTY